VVPGRFIGRCTGRFSTWVPEVRFVDIAQCVDLHAIEKQRDLEKARTALSGTDQAQPRRFVGAEARCGERHAGTRHADEFPTPHVPPFLLLISLLCFSTS
jgi:hypothetical protein